MPHLRPSSLSSFSHHHCHPLPQAATSSASQSQDKPCSLAIFITHCFLTIINSLLLLAHHHDLTPFPPQSVIIAAQHPSTLSLSTVLSIPIAITILIRLLYSCCHLLPGFESASVIFLLYHRLPDTARLVLPRHCHGFPYFATCCSSLSRSPHHSHRSVILVPSHHIHLLRYQQWKKKSKWREESPGFISMIHGYQ